MTFKTIFIVYIVVDRSNQGLLITYETIDQSSKDNADCLILVAIVVNTIKGCHKHEGSVVEYGSCTTYDLVLSLRLCLHHGLSEKIKWAALKSIDWSCKL